MIDRTYTYELIKSDNADMWGFMVIRIETDKAVASCDCIYKRKSTAQRLGNRLARDMDEFVWDLFDQEKANT